MTNSINNTSGVGELHNLADKRSTETQEVQTTESGHENTGIDQVTLTTNARQLSDLVKLSASEPDVDTAKVEAIRDSIARGEYVVDSTRIAERMVEFEKLLGR